MSLKKQVVIGLLVIVFLAVGLLAVKILAKAASENIYSENCELAGGTYIEKEGWLYCINITYQPALAWFGCPTYVNLKTQDPDITIFDFWTISKISCGDVTFFTTNTLERGRCKLLSVEDGLVRGTISASGLGFPSYLRLKDATENYKLPVLQSNIVRDDVTGEWTAEFSGRDWMTGQALAPEGEYSVTCFGTEGTGDGIGVFAIKITR